MLQKWKDILANWINCYFHESEKCEQCVTLDSLLNIIAHLRENLSLDESKSSLLEANTVEEFVQEKFPDFRLEDGSVKAQGEDETCYIASLLLFFVCVNSKDVGMKSAMCSRLRGEDQETIMKFSKRLMDCATVTLKDVEVAVAEACGQDIPMVEASGSRPLVAETPPALRSLHGEVRRLQAALDAERFDRNYLQEELARTNLKVEKFAKDKEQYKLEIVNLKAKISMCCGQESDSRACDVTSEGSTKLMRQLEEMEERLVETQGQLDDAQYERDAYKAKINELKQERDKWLSLSQQDTARASQLSEELELERRHVQSLRDLVTELRQHNQLNRLDSSLLECDDPDASIQSLPHNTSVCSEACANVIEVQLGEERAKIVVLKQHIQSLQDQLNDLTEKSESEKLSMERVISERENDIFNLKHRINEEIEEKNNMTIQYSDDVSKLNNEINELEQKLKDNNNQCRLIVEMKMQEIQTLQEEKLSLLQSLTDETTKLEGDIKRLKSELEAEKNSKAKMKEDYENHIMKLNEKVLNRNNELVELQNNVFEKSEQLEALYLEIRKEKQAKEELVAKHRDDLEEISGKLMQTEHLVQRKSDEITDLVERLNYNFGIVKECEREIEDLKYSLTQQSENCKSLEETKARLLEELSTSSDKIEGLYKNIENSKNVYSQELDKLSQNLDSAIATVNTLQTQLQDELQYKIRLQDEYANLEHSKALLFNEVEILKAESNKLQHKLQNKDKTIEGLDLFLQEEKRMSEKAKLDCQDLNEKLEKISQEMVIKNNEVKDIRNKLLAEKDSLNEKLLEKEKLIQIINTKLSTEVELKSNLEMELNTERKNISQELNDKTKEITEMRASLSKMNEVIQHNRKCFQLIESKLEEETLKCAHLEKSFDTHTTKLMHKLNITEKVIKELKIKYKQGDEDRKRTIQLLKVEVEKLNRMIETEREHTVLVQREKESVASKLAQELSYKMNFEKEYQNQVKKFTDVTSQLNNQIVSKNKEMDEKVQELLRTIDERQAEIQILEEELSSQVNNQKETIQKKDEEIDELKKKISELNKSNDNILQDLKNEIEHNNQTIQVLQKENEQLHFTIEEDNISHEILKKEKDGAIEKLEERLRMVNVQLESIQKDFEDCTFTFEKYKIEAQDNLKAKDVEINKLEATIQDLQQNLDQKKVEAEKDKEQLTNKIYDMRDMLKNVDSERRSDLMSYIDDISEEETKVKDLTTQLDHLKDELIEEKNMRIKFQTKSQELRDKIRILKQQLKETETDYNKLNENNAALLDEKAMLTQQLIEEKSTRKIVEEQKEILEDAKATLLEKFEVEMVLKNGLLEDKERLTQQLVEEKSAKELAEKEKENMATRILEETKAKENLIQELYTVMQEDMTLRQQLKQVEIEKQKIKSDNEMLLNALNEEKGVKDELVKEKDSLANEVEAVKRDLAEVRVFNDSLSTDINRLIIEKESLLNSLQETKVACEEHELERNHLVKSVSLLKEHNEKQTLEMNEKQREFEIVKRDLASVKTKKEECDESNTQIAAILTNGVDRLLNNLKKEDISNELLNKLTSIDNSEALSIMEKCNLVVNIAETLTTELSLRKNLEKALEHENTALGEIRQMLGKKEIQVLELQAEINRMQQIINENRIEMLKQKESYVTSSDTNARNIQTLQQENQSLINELNDVKVQLEVKVHSLKEKLTDSENLTEKLKKTYECQIENLNVMVTKLTNYLKDKTLELDVMRKEKERLQEIVDDNNKVIRSLEEEVKAQKQNQEKLLSEFESERLVLKNMVTVTESVMEDQKLSLNNVISNHIKDNEILKEENNALKEAMEAERKLVEIKIKEKENLFDNVFKELTEIRSEKENCQKDFELEKLSLVSEIERLKKDLCTRVSQVEILELQNKELANTLQNCKDVAASSEKTGSHKNSGPIEKEYCDFLHQVDNTTSDLTHSSMDSIKTISDLEKIIHDKNKTITTLQSDITYLKTLIADSENKLLDINKELEVSKENCHQLSGQLKKIVHQKNEEIADLRRQVNKMSVTENRATQIIKVSAKYQAIILKRIAEIKSNTVLKELTNFGNSANGDNDLRRSLNAGTITMEDLENFLETTDKHLKRCSEKQIALQKERDRLTEVNRINESEIINLKKFLTELSVSFKTFSAIKDLYAQKFSRVVQMQRTVRREILNLEGHINDATMCKLERGYAAVMQDLSECVMNMERWVERCIGRTVSAEKIKQAFTADDERASLAPATFQNAGLEVQLEELENSFQKLLEEVVRAQKGEGAKDAQAVTVMEVRAEYEDKLNRMKAKMRQLCQEQLSVYKEKQKEEISVLERELAKTREKMAESSKAYEEHIRALTAELWSVGEKFLTKKDEVDWLRKRQRSGSLMSLQHVHSSGLVPPQEAPSRPSDTHSLRSLPVNDNTNTNKNKREGRGLHMSDEEGEVFDNRWLKELSSTPGRPSISASTPSRGTGVRLSELRWRNSLCPPHLKSSYPAETQFAPAFDEEDLKFSLGGASSIGGRNQRKEVGITAYKKPGPPTPSKQAGRLSATDSELRESLRVEAEPAARRAGTPSRLRALFRSSKAETTDGTPRSKRLSIFRKK